MLFIGHIIAIIMMIDIVSYTLLNISIRDQIHDHGKWVIALLSMVQLLIVYRYYQKHLNGIIRKYEERYSGESHWKWFAVAAVILCINTGIVLGLVQFAVSQYRW